MKTVTASTPQVPASLPRMTNAKSQVTRGQRQPQQMGLLSLPQHRPLSRPVGAQSYCLLLALEHGRGGRDQPAGSSGLSPCLSPGQEGWGCSNAQPGGEDARALPEKFPAVLGWSCPRRVFRGAPSRAAHWALRGGVAAAAGRGGGERRAALKACQSLRTLDEGSVVVTLFKLSE